MKKIYIAGGAVLLYILLKPTKSKQDVIVDKTVDKALDVVKEVKKELDKIDKEEGKSKAEIIENEGPRVVERDDVDPDPDGKEPEPEPEPKPEPKPEYSIQPVEPEKEENIGTTFDISTGAEIDPKTGLWRDPITGEWISKDEWKIRHANPDNQQGTPSQYGNEKKNDDAIDAEYEVIKKNPAPQLEDKQDADDEKRKDKLRKKKAKKRASESKEAAQAELIPYGSDLWIAKERNRMQDKQTELEQLEADRKVIAQKQVQNIALLTTLAGDAFKNNIKEQEQIVELGTGMTLPEFRDYSVDIDKQLKITDEQIKRLKIEISNLADEISIAETGTVGPKRR